MRKTTEKPPVPGLSEVVRTARYAGHASTMAISLWSRGQAERAEVWLDEEEVWKRRLEGAIAASPAGESQLRDAALEVQLQPAMALIHTMETVRDNK